MVGRWREEAATRWWELPSKPTRDGVGWAHLECLLVSAHADGARLVVEGEGERRA